MSNLIKGYDISQLQGAIDFEAVKASGIAFIIARCGVGNDAIDINYSNNIQNAKAAGLLTACYHFVYPLPFIASQPLRDPTKQAQYHFNASQGELAFCDLEWPLLADWNKWNCSKNQIVDWTFTYLSAYQKMSGQKMGIYSYPDYIATLSNPLAFDGYQLWIASYETTPAVPAPWKDYVVWQASGGTEKLPNGIPVDLDYVKDLSLWTSDIATVVPTLKPPGSILTAPPPVPSTPPVKVVIPPPSPLPAPPTPIVVPTPAPPKIVPPDSPTKSSIWQTIGSWIAKIFGK